MSMTKRSRNRGILATLAKSRSVLKACGRGGGTGATRASAHNPPTRGRGGSPRSTASSGAVDQSGSARRRFDSQRPAPPPRKAARRPHRDHEVRPCCRCPRCNRQGQSAGLRFDQRSARHTTDKILFGSNHHRSIRSPRRAAGAACRTSTAAPSPRGFLVPPIVHACPPAE